MTESTIKAKPWDAKLAYLLVRPLQNTWVTPNHLTTLRLVAGLAASASVAFLDANLGAALFVLSGFIDHTDGELARLTGKYSKFGHQYDLISDAIVLLSLFLSIGYAAISSQLGMWAILLSVIASLSVSAIFYLMNEMELRLGKEQAGQPSFGGFEAEDILYLFPLVTLSNNLVLFLIAAAIGSPLFAIWVIWQYLASYRA
jgi:phosphatidylglycerophosphate synthase